MVTEQDTVNARNRHGKSRLVTGCKEWVESDLIQESEGQSTPGLSQVVYRDHKENRQGSVDAYTKSRGHLYSIKSWSANYSRIVYRHGRVKKGIQGVR